MKRLFKFAALLFATILVSSIFFFITVWAGFWGKIPGKSELIAVENQLSSEIFAKDGELLGKYFIYDRSHVNPDQVSQNLINTLIATEDHRFYKHRGIDYYSLGRVFFKTLLRGDGSAGGGSTISQQLAKNLYSRNNNGLMALPVSKFREFIIAHRLERIYTKEEILLLYLNTVPFGENVFGISAASLRFFNKNPLDLNIEESATLIGMLKATSFYNPRRFPERAQARRNTVIGQLHRHSFITGEQNDSLTQIPLQIDYNPISHNQGPAPYFREMARKQINEILNAYNTQHNTSYNLFTDGLKINTSIDYQLQLMSEAAIKRQMISQQRSMDAYYRRMTPERGSQLLTALKKSSPRYKSLQDLKLSEADINQQFNSPLLTEFFSWEGPRDIEISPMDSIFKSQQILHAGLIALDPSDGSIRAWVGGNDFRFFQYDHILAKRQAGSTFKPFLYATALQMGFDPCEYTLNELITYEEYDDWTPENANGEYGGYYSMMGALAHSVNTVSAHYIERTGVLPVIENARNAGINSPMPRTPSLALGTANVSLLEMTAAYGSFLNPNKNLTPKWLHKITDRNGNVIFEDQALTEPEEIWDTETALLSRKMLEAVVDSGTARSLRHRFAIRGDLAGKTGTTQNNADTWFVGFSPGLITGVWTGLENPGFARLYGAPLGSGASAVPVWGDFMSQAQRNPQTRHYFSGNFSPLPDTLAARLDCSMFLEELPQENWWEGIFGRPEERDQRRRERQREEPSRLRRWLEGLF